MKNALAGIAYLFKRLLAEVDFTTVFPEPSPVEDFDNNRLSTFRIMDFNSRSDFEVITGGKQNPFSFKIMDFLSACREALFFSASAFLVD